MQPFLTLKNTKKNYYEKKKLLTRALNDISLELHTGEIFGLLGVNGAGKTTLSSIIASLILFTSGEVLWKGKSIYTNLLNYRRALGFCPQKTNLDQALTLEQILTPTLLSCPAYVFPNESDESSILSRAQAIFTKVITGGITSSHQNANLVVDSVYQFNCYGFINHLLHQAHPLAYLELMLLMNHLKESVPPSFDGQPCPFNYAAIFDHIAIHGSLYWEVIEHIDTVRPGDLLVYLPLEYIPSVKPNLKGRTGTHIMIVEKIEEKGGQYQLTILDSTNYPHNKSDTRYEVKGTGIGQSLLFITPANNHYQLQWKPGGASPQERPMVCPC